jgi:hypothetical protein
MAVARRWEYVHRVIFLYHHGYLPPAVDHRNRIKVDNRIENLRAANCRKYKGKTSRFKGVVFDKNLGKFTTHVGGRHIGVFTDEVEAARAYDAEAKKEFGEFACTNF